MIGNHGRFPRSIPDAAIAEARRLAAAGVKRRDIADRTGIHPRALSDVLRGIRRPDAPGKVVPDVLPEERERRRHAAFMARVGKSMVDWALVEGRIGVEPDSVVARALGVSQSAVLQRRRRLGIEAPRLASRVSRSKVGGARKGAGRPPLPAGRKAMPLNLTVAPGLHARIVAAAAAADVSRSEWMARAAELALEHG